MSDSRFPGSSEYKIPHISAIIFRGGLPGVHALDGQRPEVGQAEMGGAHSLPLLAQRVDGLMDDLDGGVVWHG